MGKREGNKEGERERMGGSLAAMSMRCVDARGVASLL